MVYNEIVRQIFLSMFFGVLLLASPKCLAANVNVSADVSTNLNMSFSTATISFGPLIPGTPAKGSNGIDIDVTTSAADGYNLSINDGVVSNGSALLHTDTTTRILDFSHGIASPDFWTSGVSTGLGFTTYYADTSKEGKWGTGTTYNDSNNKYAGIPQDSTIFHASSGYKAGSDRTSITFILDVPNDQKTGSYDGNITVSATAIIP